MAVPHARVPPAAKAEERVIEHRKSRQRQALSARAVHEALRFEGNEELGRRWRGVAWSGLAAGISMGLSLLAEGILLQHVPDTPWRPLLTKLGYPVGFIAVTLGRQQLFTETTVTAVLPRLHRRSVGTFIKVVRFWTVVLVTNLIGAFLFAWAATQPSAFSADLHEALEQIGHEAARHDAWPAFIRGIFGGWMIALMVWLMPAAAGMRLWVIVIVTYLIAVTGMTHVLAGSLETFYVVAAGEMSFGHYLARYGLPVLAGNTIGGVVFVTLLNHAQVVSGEPDGGA